ncbi:MAG: NAD+ synthase [Ignavibacteriaceae bacterium]|nr:NAD+ synthase [Ignavibacteriaceae bacterium]
MKIALCQMNPIIGDIQYNKNKIIQGYRKGEKDKVDLVIFPELALIGYPPQDLVEKSEFRNAAVKAANEIASITGATGLIFGSITENDDKIGTDIHNSALLCFDGQIKFVQHKSLIPNYDVFDEMRYFDAASEVNVFNFKGSRLGISVCEDIWNDEDYWHRRRYVFDPVKKLVDDGIDLLINISASPYAYGKRASRKEMLSVLTKQDKVPLVYVCCVGAQTDLVFDGASMCFDNIGRLVKLGKSYEEDYLIFDDSVTYEEITNCEGSFEQEIHDALIYGLREYCQKLNFKKALIGLSGGIDSAIVTYIAVKALGKENVHVVLLPSKYSSEGSITDSLTLIKKLGISYDEISIQSAVDQIINSVFPAFNNDLKSVTEENLQARIRGVYLMALSNNNNYLLLTTGNKSEMAVGYSTLYGDMCGGLAVIADVYKTDIYRLADYINREEKIIPQEIINKPPSAELKPNQKDQDTLPPYEILDNILKMYLEQNKEFDAITSEVKDETIVRKVLRMVDLNEFKRKQAAPALRVSTKAFGYGRRYPIVQGWRK